MPGTFAHMTLVADLCERTRLNGIGELSEDVKHALVSNEKFCELGAVSPDYPYLKLFNKEAEGWANVMHYWRTGDFIRTGVRHLSEMFADFRAADAQRCIAWLFGYASHVVADLTVHPVVEKRVGKYETNQTEHRRCELNQDAYIFMRKFEEEIASLQYLERGGLEACGAKLGDTHRLAPAVCKLWTLILSEVPLASVSLKEDLPTPHHPPRPDEWHHSYMETIERISEDGKWLFLARGVAEDEALVYPAFKDVDMSYIKNLETPALTRTDYDEVFRRAQENILGVWGQLGSALTARNPELLALVNGDLDTGMADGASPGTRQIFWAA